MTGRLFWVSVGKTRFDTKWKNKELEWSEIVERLRSVTRTQETQAEYFRMSKPDQDKIKDVGGFVGGVLNGGRRKADTVRSRSILTLDADYASETLWDDIMESSEHALLLYTTHKHTADKPRFRAIIPLDRDVSPDEYEAIARKTAERFGIDYFDDTTYQPSRLMYWPSCSRDGDFNVEELSGEPLSADKVLSEYPDWHDMASWPVSSRVSEIRKRTAEKQGNPLQKPGMIGPFCRAYTVPEVIEAFLSDVYEPCDNGRYTYRGGSTAAGLVLYEDGLFAYSNHATDPASGVLCNAFDLVRLHRFGGMDSKSKPDTSVEKLPSHKAMCKLAAEDKKVRKLMSIEQTAGAIDDFDNGYVDEDEIGEFTFLPSGIIEDTIRNGVIAIRRNSRLNGLRYNKLGSYIECGDVPWPHTEKWSDSDDVQLRALLEGGAFKFKKQTLLDAVDKLAHDREYHPILEYLEKLPEWDGIKRVDSLLIDYLGAEDSDYTRAVTRKTLCAAYRRVKVPGCKFDTILVLNGPQGVGKSTLIAKLGGRWFNDSLSLHDVGGKAGPEKLQGYWILELSELAGMRKAEVESLRGFISRTDDVYREAYARRTQSHKRQCVFIGTTNAEDDGYLRDMQGNRRFWDVRLTGSSLKKPWDLTQADIDQIWAEVKLLEPEEPLTLSGDVARIAEQKQNEAIESSPLEAIVCEYLDTAVPEDWYSRSLSARRAWLDADLEGRSEGTMLRDYISIAEIWYECLGKPLGALTRKDSYEIANIMKRLHQWQREASGKRIKGYGYTKVYKRVSVL